MLADHQDHFSSLNKRSEIMAKCRHYLCHYLRRIYYIRSILNCTWTAGATISTSRNTIATNKINNCIKLTLTKLSQMLETLLLSMAKKILANSNHCTGCRNFFTDKVWQFQVYHSELQETTEYGNVGDSQNSKRINQSEFENSNSSRFKFDSTVKSDVMNIIIGCAFKLRPQGTKDASSCICTRYQTLVMSFNTTTTQMSILQYLLQISLHICKLYFTFHQEWRKICLMCLIDQLRYAPIITSA